MSYITVVTVDCQAKTSSLKTFVTTYDTSVMLNLTLKAFVEKFYKFTLKLGL